MHRASVQTTRRLHRVRRGISLLEVMACTALVAMLMVPMAGMIRYSGQVIRRSEGTGTTQSTLPHQVLVLQRLVADCDEIVSVSRNRLRLLRSGIVHDVQLDRQRLTSRSPAEEIVIVENLRRLQFSDPVTDPSGRIHALTMTIDTSGNGGVRTNWTGLLVLER